MRFHPTSSCDYYRFLVVVVVASTSLLPQAVTSFRPLSYHPATTTTHPRSRPTSLLAISSSTSEKDVANSPNSIYGTAEINYSAANEYLDEQYGHRIPHPYFPHTKSNETIVNGRMTQPKGLETHGFAVNSHDLIVPNHVEYTHKEDLRQHYLPLLQKYFQQVYGRDNIQHLFFYNPMLRGQDLECNTPSELPAHELPTSPTQTMAHMDNDWPASDVDRVVGLVQYQSLDYYDNYNQFPRQAVQQAIQDGHRFLIVNCWRNADPEHPIPQSPLGIFPAHYPPPNEEQKPYQNVFPHVRPDFDRSQWYVFPDMTSNECLLFKQFDRHAGYISDVWHTALHTLQIHNPHQNSTNQNSRRRKSFDIRAFIVLNEIVDESYDRYGPNRVEPNYKTAEEHQKATS